MLQPLRKLVAVLGAIGLVLWVWSVVHSQHPLNFWLVVTLALVAVSFAWAWLEDRKPKGVATTIHIDHVEQVHIGMDASGTAPSSTPDGQSWWKRIGRPRIVHIAREVLDDGSPVIEGRVFEDVLILGPAVIVPLGNFEMTSCNWQGNVEGMFLHPETSWIEGAIGVKDCVFRRCTFRKIGFTGGEDILGKIKQGFSDT